ncbi:MAG: glycosyltransferase family 2 protein [Bdellovibrionota bacterium]
MKLSVIIPVFNEAHTLLTLLNRVWNHNISGIDIELIIVESNSTDGSREIVKTFAARIKEANPAAALQLILEDKPRGKGHAVRTGFNAVTGDIILIQDADLEYDINDYESLIQPILRGHASFVLGSRHLSAGSWRIRQFSNDRINSVLFNFGGIFFHTLFNIVYGQWLTDPTTMFKVFKRSCITDIFFTANRFDFDYELVGKLIRSGYLPFEVPVSYESRCFKDGKKIRIFSDPWTWLVAILKYRFSRLKIDKALLPADGNKIGNKA